MNADLSLAHLTVLHASPAELVAIAARTGYRYVGLRLTEVVGGDAWPLITDRALQRETRSRMAATGVGVLDVELVRLRPETQIADFRPMLEVAAELGARHVLTQGQDPEWQRLVANYAGLCDLAASYGMTADLEFIPWNDVRDVADANRLIDAAGRENGGLMVDTLHFSRSRCRLQDLDAVPADRFHYIQIADAVGEIPDDLEALLHTAREARLFPGEGDLDLRGMLGRLPAAIPVAVEIPNSQLARTMSDDERALAAYTATRRLLDSLQPADAATNAQAD